MVKAQSTMKRGSVLSARSLFVSLVLVGLVGCQALGPTSTDAPSEAVAGTAQPLPGASGEWTSFPTDARGTYSGIELGDGSVLVCGGWDSSSPQNYVLSCNRFSYDSGLRRQTFPLPEARLQATLSLVPPNRVLLAGGMDSKGNALTARLSSPFPWNDNQNIWGAPEANSASSARRSGHTATRLDTSIVLIGGETDGVQVPTLARRSDDGTWTRVDPGSGIATRIEHTATVLKNESGGAERVLVLGGQSQGNFLSSGFIFSLPNNIEQIADMPEARAGHTATLLDDGSILVAGGRGSGETLLASAWRYDPTKHTWSSAGSIVPRKYHAAVRLGTDVLVAGGVSNVRGSLATLGGSSDAPANDNTVLRYDPTQKTWAAAPNFVQGRREFQLFTLDAAHLLAVGGENDYGSLSNSELFSAGVLGEVVTKSSACLSNHLVDGVCCESACDGACNRCNDPAQPGKCEDIDGPAPSPKGCDHFLQCSMGTCPTQCDSSHACVDGYYCSGNHTCQPVKGQGVRCNARGECANGLPCVDGVCCESACPGSCESCDQQGHEGICLPRATGDAPHAGHPACPVSADTSCAAACDGRTTTHCVFPAAGSSCGGPATCTADGLQPPSECDGRGTCEEPAPVSCGPFACGQRNGKATCLNSCTTDSQCAVADGYHCDQGACTRCVESECNGFTCDLQAGECRNSCEFSGRDCIGGYYCHPLQHRCVEGVNFPAAALPACGIGHEPSQSHGSMIALISLLCAIAARRTRQPSRRV